MKRILILAAFLAVSAGVAATVVSNRSAAVTNPEKTFVFATLPTNVEELKALPEATLKDPYAVAALSVLALTRYEESLDDCYEMLNFLKGPDPLNAYQKTFLKDRFRGNKYYKVFSFFKGATPENGYTPSQPYTITVSTNSYSFQSEGWATMYLTSGGADSPRPVKLRQKKSTGEWFLNEIQYLSDIRVPAEEDPWN